MKFLFVIDPIKNINPLKDSTAALMQASSKKNIENRLLIRNRENKDEINKRLNRKIENLPSDTIYVENDSDLESGVDNLINALNG